MNEKIKDKISKLLSLAGSPNENEAQAALLKARTLMAKYKLSESDIEEIQSKKVVTEYTEITCTKMTNPWISELCIVIAENYCCKAVVKKVHCGKTYTIGFVGLDDDISVCKSVFLYAYKFVMNSCAEIKKLCKEEQLPSSYIRRLCNSYGSGFVCGLCEMYENQDRTEETGLVLVTPKEVVDAISEMSKLETSFSNNDDKNHPAVASKGYYDGLNFTPNSSLEGDEK